MTTPRNILFVAWGYPPHRGPGAYRPLAMTNFLASRGHKVTVLTADRNTFELVSGADTELEAQIDPRINVVRVPMDPFLRDPVISRWPEERATNPRGYRDRMHKLSMAAFPEPYYSVWYSPVNAVARELQRTEKFDLVIATGNPYVDFSVAIKLGLENNIPYILDDRDAWLFNVYNGELVEEAAEIRPWLETGISQALESWFVNPPLADLHRQEFPHSAHKIQVVENGWDQSISAISSAEPNTGQGASNQVDRPLRFSYIGTINATLPLNIMFEAWALARAADPLIAQSEFKIVGQFGHGGAKDQAQIQLLNEYKQHNITVTGRIPKPEIARIYADTDVLLFAKEGGRYVTSGKVYEYLSSNLPIASLVEAEHDARRVLSGYPRWFDAEEFTPQALANALVAAAHDSRENPHLADTISYSNSFNRTHILSETFARVENKLGWV